MSREARIESGPLVVDAVTDTHDPLRKGTLHYTKYSLCLMFFFLLWGDFVLNLMENVIPKVLPLQLKELGASNTTMGVLVVSMGYLFNLIINPLVSFQSDNLRTAWGRRIPYLLVVTPFVTVLLIAMAFAPEIGHAVHRTALGAWLKASPNTIIIGTMAVILVLFQIFNFCLQPVYYYLFVDVVPNAYMARFMALFRIVGSAQAYLFMTYIYGHSLTHTRAIYISFALAYFVGFMAICFWVKEGEYPPPVHKKMGFIKAAETYFRECYSHPHYIYFNLRNASVTLAQVVGIYSVFVYRDELGIPLDFLGKVGGWTSLIAIVLLYPMGMICDRFNAVRVLTLMTMLVGLTYLFSFFLLTRDTYVFLALLGATIMTLMQSCEMPYMAIILPTDRFGQFGSANQLVLSIILIAGGYVSGKFLDWATVRGTVIPNYRYQFLWSAFFQAIGAFFMLMLYFSWKKHGGAENYLAPEPWNEAKNLAETSPAEAVLK